MIEEYEHNLALAPNEGLKRYRTEDALNERILEWLETPVGSVADHPGWGSTLAEFKFEPPGVHLEVMLEMELVEKITRDIRDIVIVSIRVETMEIDLYKVVIEHSLGVMETEVAV